MVTFSKLKRYDVSADTAAHMPLRMIRTPDPAKPLTLILKPATMHNRGFYNESMRRLERLPSVRDSEPDVVASALRALDRELFAAHVLVGWEEVYDDEDNRVPFTAENAGAFLAALPDSIFDSVRVFARDEDNYRGRVPIEAALGNSSSASVGS